MTHGHNVLAMQGFAELLEVYLRRSGYKSLRSFAKAAGVSASTVHTCLRGTRAPPIERIPRWCKALRLSAEQARDFTFAAYRTKGWSQADARPYIKMAEEVLTAAAEQQRAAESDLQELNRKYGERTAEYVWGLKRIKQLEEELRGLGQPLPPPPPHPPLPPLNEPPAGSGGDTGSAGPAPA